MAYATFKEWYEDNRERLSVKRKAKYRNDPEYRRKALERARRYYKLKRKKMVPADRRLVVAPDGSRYLTIGKLSKLINRSIQTIRAYHRQGVIPNVRHTDGRGWRLYTPGQAALLRKVFRAFDEGKLGSLEQVKRVVHKYWDRVG